MTAVSTSFTTRTPMKTPRERAADGFHAALTSVLTTGLDDALAAGDHSRAVGVINRGFAEGDPELGCELLRRAIAAVGPTRTWTVQIAPRSSSGDRVDRAAPSVGPMTVGGRELAHLQPRQG